MSFKISKVLVHQIINLNHIKLDSHALDHMAKLSSENTITSYSENTRIRAELEIIFFMGY
jgi:hypothetical protein